MDRLPEIVARGRQQQGIGPRRLLQCVVLLTEHPGQVRVAQLKLELLAQAAVELARHAHIQARERDEADGRRPAHVAPPLKPGRHAHQQDGRHQRDELRHGEQARSACHHHGQGQRPEKSHLHGCVLEGNQDRQSPRGAEQGGGDDHQPVPLPEPGLSLLDRPLRVETVHARTRKDVAGKAAGPQGADPRVGVGQHEAQENEQDDGVGHHHAASAGHGLVDLHVLELGFQGCGAETEFAGGAHFRAFGVKPRNCLCCQRIDSSAGTKTPPAKAGLLSYLIPSRNLGESGSPEKCRQAIGERNHEVLSISPRTALSRAGCSGLCSMRMPRVSALR